MTTIILTIACLGGWKAGEILAKIIVKIMKRREEKKQEKGMEKRLKDLEKEALKIKFKEISKLQLKIIGIELDRVGDIKTINFILADFRKRLEALEGKKKSKKNNK